MYHCVTFCFEMYRFVTVLFSNVPLRITVQVAIYTEYKCYGMYSTDVFVYIQCRGMYVLI
jgi:hypothetical protein